MFSPIFITTLIVASLTQGFSQDHDQLATSSQTQASPSTTSPLMMLKPKSCEERPSQREDSSNHVDSNALHLEHQDSSVIEDNSSTVARGSLSNSSDNTAAKNSNSREQSTSEILASRTHYRLSQENKNSIHWEEQKTDGTWERTIKFDPKKSEGTSQVLTIFSNSNFPKWIVPIKDYFFSEYAAGIDKKINSLQFSPEDNNEKRKTLLSLLNRVKKYHQLCLGYLLDRTPKNLLSKVSKFFFLQKFCCRPNQIERSTLEIEKAFQKLEKYQKRKTGIERSLAITPTTAIRNRLNDINYAIHYQQRFIQENATLAKIISPPFPTDLNAQIRILKNIIDRALLPIRELQIGKELLIEELKAEQNAEVHGPLDTHNRLQTGLGIQKKTLDEIKEIRKRTLQNYSNQIRASELFFNTFQHNFLLPLHPAFQYAKEEIEKKEPNETAIKYFIKAAESVEQSDVSGDESTSYFNMLRDSFFEAGKAALVFPSNSRTIDYFLKAAACFEAACLEYDSQIPIKMKRAKYLQEKGSCLFAVGELPKHGAHLDVTNIKQYLLKVAAFYDQSLTLLDLGQTIKEEYLNGQIKSFENAAHAALAVRLEEKSENLSEYYYVQAAMIYGKAIEALDADRVIRAELLKLAADKLSLIAQKIQENQANETLINKELEEILKYRNQADAQVD